MTGSQITPEPSGVWPDGWRIRGYLPGDEHALVELFQRAFGKAITTEFWRWKLKGIPSPVENVFLALDGERPIFQYAGIPLPFRLLDRESTVMVSVETMADPEYRRRGLLTAVGRVSYTAWSQAGISFVLGLPNEQWGSRTAALGWLPLFTLRWMARPLRPEALLARRLGVPWLANALPFGHAWNRCLELSAPAADPSVVCRPVERAGREVDALWSRVGGVLSVVRDSRFLNWRYCDAPGHGYHLLMAERDGEPVGYAAYRVHRSPDRVVGYIADLFAPAAGGAVGIDDSSRGRNGPRVVRQALLTALLHSLFELGADVALTLAVPGTPLEAELRRMGFFVRPGAFDVQLLPLAPELPRAALSDPRRWHIAGGDFDVV